ncbi:MAG: hypothetical protein ACYSTJ_07620, partial [Planctomycetota bacterium]
MNRKMLLLVSFVFVAGLGGLAQAGTPIDVNNWSFEFDADGNQIYCHTGSMLAWEQVGNGWVGVDPYCLGDADYDPCSLTMVCTPEECFTDNHDGCHCWAAMHGICYNYTQAGETLYQELDANDPNAIIAIGRQYTFTLDGMSEVYGEAELDNLWMVPAMFYGQGGDSNHVELASKAHLLKTWVGDLNEWEHEWEPNLIVRWVATEGHPALGKV